MSFLAVYFVLLATGSQRWKHVGPPNTFRTGCNHFKPLNCVKLNLFGCFFMLLYLLSLTFIEFMQFMNAIKILNKNERSLHLRHVYTYCLCMRFAVGFQRAYLVFRKQVDKLECGNLAFTFTLEFSALRFLKQLPCTKISFFKRKQMHWV